MSRRRSTPWIYRWSRQIIGAIAIAGALLTAYLTITKLTGGVAACPISAEGTASCSDVLSSKYATVLGLPLSLFGFLAYTSMATFALGPLAIKSEAQKSLRSNLEGWTWLLLFAGGTAMTIFSGYLMYLLAFEIKALCLWCIASALFSTSLFLLSIIGRSWEDIGQLLFTGVVVGMVALIGTLGVYASVNTPVAVNGNSSAIPAFSGEPKPGVGWDITTTSGPAELALVEHLNQKGFKMYGAYWCPHCHEQKLVLGKEAAKKLTYIECADIKNPGKQAEICAKAGIKSYPSWEINGKIEPGVLSGEKLAELSGYQGSRKFKYSLSER